VTHFGKQQSIVVFLYNNEPIATRYHFEIDHDKYLPTITFENGPIECDVMWPDAVIDIPQLFNVSYFEMSINIYSIASLLNRKT
jgi:hypothetical protein